MKYFDSFHCFSIQEIIRSNSVSKGSVSGLKVGEGEGIEENATVSLINMHESG